MSEGNPGDNQNNQQQQSSNQNTGYSADYVKSLRDEAAGWRSKLRESEATIATMNTKTVESSIGSMLETKGIKCDPSFIKVAEGQTIEQAVDKFATEYPQFKVEATTEENNDNTNTNNTNIEAMNTRKENTNTNNRGSKPTDVAAVKKDPIARAKLRDQYRSMLQNQRK